MQSFPSVILHRAKTGAVKRFHPWVFSGAIKKTDKGVQPGDIVNVFSEDQTFLGTGHYGGGSIAVRIFSFKPVEDLQALWIEKLQLAKDVRRKAGLADNDQTNTYRLVFGEGDGMPGIIIDWYNGTAIIQAHTLGMYRERERMVVALQKLYGNRLRAVYDKSKAALHDGGTSATAGDSYLLGEPATNLVREHGHSFKIDWIQGQKTGFFIDQRENRQLLAHYSKHKKVLNTFCYSGGFSVYALKAGAQLVHSVDSSAKAIEWTNENVLLNTAEADKHASFTADIFEFLKGSNTIYDVIVLDPPAFAKSQNSRHNALKAYQRLNLMALQKIQKGGILFTFSCSQVVSPEQFAGAVTAAGIEAGRNIRILHHLTQPADHPVSLFNPEGLYLKGLVLHVE